MKVLVTGSNGFIGSHICNFFHKKGYEVIGLAKQKLSKSWKTIVVDLLDSKEIENLLYSINPDIIIHCAGMADVHKSIVFPKLDYDLNVTITHNLLFIMNKLKMKTTNFIFLSSCSVYGNCTNPSINEKQKESPLSPYALHKVMCEDICKYMYNYHKMNVKILRISSVYGPGLKKQIFWDVYKSIRKTGNIELRSDGQDSRDFIYIDDLIQAIYLVIKNSSKEELIYNIGNGEEIFIKDVVYSIAKEFNISENKIKFNKNNKNNKRVNFKADITKIKKLGYKKTISFEKGMRNYLNWLIKNNM